jgi:membrane-associated phospholipid phosphatase
MKLKKYKKVIKNPSVQLLAAAILFILAWFLSRGAVMTDWEILVFNYIYGLPSFLTPLFLAVTQFGNIMFLILLVAVLIYKKRHDIAIKLLLGGALAYLITGVAKDLWGRLRPSEYLNDVIVRELYVRGPGFPSGHTALATVIAFMLAAYLPKKYHALIWVSLGLVMLSRIYLGVHAPLDIVGGFAVGWFAYAIFAHVQVRPIRKHFWNFLKR